VRADVSGGHPAIPGAIGILIACSAGAALMVDNWLSDLITLWTVVDPIGTVPVFASVTHTMPRGDSQRIARQSVIVAGGVLVGFLVLGQVLLQAMHIGMDSFQVAGGLVLFLFAMMMVFGYIHADPSDHAAADQNPAVFPLAMPVIASPGAILAIVVLTDNDRFAFPHQARTAMVLLAVLVVQWILLYLATPIQRWLGRSAMSIASRVMGLILAALSVETIVGGVRGLLRAG
jgi:multiple antibiotic resistance protein